MALSALPPSSPSPWFEAGYDGDCSECFEPFYEGDTIRSDGDGGWELQHDHTGEAPEPSAADRAALSRGLRSSDPAPLRRVLRNWERGLIGEDL